MSRQNDIQKVAIMLEMQDAMNRKVHPDWFHQNFEWYRAIWIECGEMLDHYGWKWWKHQEPDREQVILELVDIFHFGLSLRIDGETPYEELASAIVSELENVRTAETFRETLELLAGEAVVNKAFDVASFAGCLQQIDMTLDDLFKGYVGKNTLNFFRQDNGYKEGSYIKVWHGKEDNEHLVEVVAALDPNSPTFKEDVYKGLTDRYPS